jgi:hypothetical protein
MKKNLLTIICLIFVFLPAGLVYASEFPGGNCGSALQLYIEKMGHSTDLLKEENAQKLRWAVLALVCLNLEKQGEYPFDSYFNSPEKDSTTASIYEGAKSTYFLHSIRKSAGDEAFFNAVDKVKIDYAGRSIEWSGLLEILMLSLPEDKHEKLNKTFDAYTQNKGIPSITMGYIELHLDKDQNDKYFIKGSIDREGPAYDMFPVPYIVTLKSGEEITGAVEMPEKSAEFEIVIPSIAESIEFDPNWDMFRYFPTEDPEEMYENSELKETFTSMIVCKGGMCEMQEIK